MNGDVWISVVCCQLHFVRPASALSSIIIVNKHMPHVYIFDISFIKFHFDNQSIIITIKALWRIATDIKPKPSAEAGSPDCHAHVVGYPSVA